MPYLRQVLLSLFTSLLVGSSPLAPQAVADRRLVSARLVAATVLMFHGESELLFEYDPVLPLRVELLYGGDEVRQRRRGGGASGGVG